MDKRHLFPLLLAVAAVTPGPALAASATPVTLTAELGGAAQVTKQGDLDGMGKATLKFAPDAREICYTLLVGNLQDVTAAHLHRGAAGEDGPPVVHFAAPVTGMSEDCVAVTPEVSSEILSNPAGFYVNVHTKGHPAGAVRGQLTR